MTKQIAEQDPERGAQVGGQPLVAQRRLVGALAQRLVGVGREPADAGGRRSEIRGHGPAWLVWPAWLVRWRRRSANHRPDGVGSGGEAEAGGAGQLGDGVGPDDRPVERLALRPPSRSNQAVRRRQPVPGGSTSAMTRPLGAGELRGTGPAGGWGRRRCRCCRRRGGRWPTGPRRAGGRRRRAPGRRRPAGGPGRWPTATSRRRARAPPRRPG